MLTEKDYCDYETCVALKELGYPLTSKEVRYEDKAVFVPGVLLYSAQKWLREEKKLVILVGFDFCPITSEIAYNWVIVMNGNTAKKSSYTYDYFEEALSEGVKCAIKLLKESL